MGSKPPRRWTASSVLPWLATSLLLTLAYVALWRWTSPGYYLFLVLGTYAGLGGLTLLQLLRAMGMDRWTRRVGAFGVVVGLGVTIFLGLRPRPACLESGACLSGLTPHIFQLALGILLTTASLSVDVGRSPEQAACESDDVTEGTTDGQV